MQCQVWIKVRANPSEILELFQRTTAIEVTLVVRDRSFVGIVCPGDGSTGVCILERIYLPPQWRQDRRRTNRQSSAVSIAFGIENLLYSLMAAAQQKCGALETGAQIEPERLTFNVAGRLRVSGSRFRNHDHSCGGAN